MRLSLFGLGIALSLSRGLTVTVCTARPVVSGAPTASARTVSRTDRTPVPVHSRGLGAGTAVAEGQPV